MKPTPLPLRTVPDWRAVADMLRASGTFTLPPDIPVESGRVSLHRLGVSLRPVRDESRAIVAYEVSARKPDFSRDEK